LRLRQNVFGRFKDDLDRGFAVLKAATRPAAHPTISTIHPPLRNSGEPAPRETFRSGHTRIFAGTSANHPFTMATNPPVFSTN
jgi:hypothetical protein